MLYIFIKYSKIHIPLLDIYFYHTINSRHPENDYTFLIDVGILKMLIIYSLLSFTDLQYVTY